MNPLENNGAPQKEDEKIVKQQNSSEEEQKGGQDNYETESNWTETCTQEGENDVEYVIDPEIEEINDRAFNDEENSEPSSNIIEEIKENHEHFLKKFAFHKDSVTCLSLYKENYFYSGSIDDSLVLWDKLNSDAPVHFLSNLGETVSLISTSFDKKFTAVVIMNNSILIIDNENYKILHKVEEFQDEILSIQWHFKGNALLVGCNDGVACIVNATTGKIYSSFFGHEKGVTKAKFANEGKLVVTSSHDNTMRTWNPATGEQLHKFHGFGFHTGSIIDIDIYQKNNLVLSGGLDSVICYSNCISGKPLFISDDLGGAVECVLVSEDVDIGLSGSFDENLRVWDFSKSRVRDIIKTHGTPNKILRNAQNNCFITSTTNGYIHIFDHRCPQNIKTFQAHSDLINDVILVNDTEFLTCSEDFSIKLFKI